jgi:hypothetical protein
MVGEYLLHPVINPADAGCASSAAAYNIWQRTKFIRYFNWVRL